MRGASVIFLVVFAAPSYEKEPIASQTAHAQSFMDKLVGKLVDDLLHSPVDVWSLHHVDLNSVTLGKRGKLLCRIPSQAFHIPSPGRFVPLHLHTQSAVRPKLCVAATTRTARRTQDATDRMLSWLWRNGGGASVRPGDDINGIRGLVAEQSCVTGDVLLEVPLSLAICDGGDEDVPLAGAAPKWTWKLHPTVQLALAMLDRRANGNIDPFLESWPDEPPALPLMADAKELALGSDRALAVMAKKASSWLDEQYREASEVAAAAAAEQGIDVAGNVSFPSASAFREAMGFVWSRGLRIKAGEHGERRCLVPALDLANHETLPSSTYTFATGSPCGPSIRLYAVRSLQPGDAVTISYGEFSSTHFALLYGFVPVPNPFDSICIHLTELLLAIPSQLLGPEPSGGWPAVIKAALDDGAGGKGMGTASREFALHGGARQFKLMTFFCNLLPGGHGAAARALAITVATIECYLWDFSANSLSELDAEAQAAVEKDGCLLASAGASLTNQTRVLTKLRLERRRQLLSLRRALCFAAKRCDEDSEAGRIELETLVEGLHGSAWKINIEKFNRWEGREWDWQAHAWAPKLESPRTPRRSTELFAQNSPNIFSILAVVIIVHGVAFAMLRFCHGASNAGKEPLLAT